MDFYVTELNTKKYFEWNIRQSESGVSAKLFVTDLKQFEFETELVLIVILNSISVDHNCNLKQLVQIRIVIYTNWD